MDVQQQYRNIPDNVLLKSGIVTLTGAKDNLGCHLIMFQSHQQLLFTQMNYSRSIESLFAVITYYRCPVISFLVNMSHSTQTFIDHFIHVVDQLERKMSKGEIKRVYIVRPQKKSTQKHVAKVLGNKKENARINAQVVIVKTVDELHQHIKIKSLTVDFGGTLRHDHNAWLAVQKMLTQYYLIVNTVTSSSVVIVQRIRELTSGDLGSRSPEKSTEHVQEKRLRNVEKKKNEILGQYNFVKALEDSKKIRSYFKDPKLNEDFQALSKSPVFEWDQRRFEQWSVRMVAVKDSIDRAWKEGLERMTSLTTEKELYDRLIEYCTWITEEGLPYVTSLLVQSSTLAEAVKQKINFENEFYKPAKVTLKKCRQTLKEVRQFQRSQRMSSGGLELMSDNLTSLMENLKTKTDARMQHFKNKKDFMQTLTKAESWCERASAFCQASSSLSKSTISQNTEQELNDFLKEHPPLIYKELKLLLDYVDNFDDFAHCDRAQLLGDRCQKLERILRARGPHVPDDDDGEERLVCEDSSDDRSESSYGQNSPFKPRVHELETQKPATIRQKITNKRSHTSDDVMSSMTISNDGFVTSGELARPGNEKSRLVDIQRRLRDQELLYEQLVLEKELRELSERGGEREFSPDRTEVVLGVDKSFERQNWSSCIVNSGSADGVFERNRNSRQIDSEIRTNGTGSANFAPDLTRNDEVGNMSSVMKSYVSDKGPRAETINSRVDEVISLDSKCSHGFSTSHKDFTPAKRPDMAESSINKRKVTTSKVNDERISPSHFDLLDGCNSLKRLCKFGEISTQNCLLTTLGITSNAHDSLGGKISTQLNSRTNNLENISLDVENSFCDSAEYSRDLQNNSRHSEDHSHDFENISCVVENISRDSQSISHESAEHSRHLETISSPVENSSRDAENRLRDFESYSRDSENTSHEELVKNARETVEHWTQIKDEQRARLAQIIDDTKRRKEIEEVYFNAQIQLCRARQNAAKLQKLDATLPLNNVVMDVSMMLSFNTSSGRGNVENQLLDVEGGFQRYAKDDQNTNRSGHLGVSCDSEGQQGVLLNNEEFSGDMGSVKLDLDELSKDVCKNGSNDRVPLLELGDESDDEQESSDEFEDVEEEELMLLCSQSSSGLRSQDDLKDSLREEQVRLEEMFEAEKEELRKQREKLKEEEKRITEWKNYEMEKTQNLEMADEGLSFQNTSKEQEELKKEDQRMEQLKRNELEEKEALGMVGEDSSKEREELREREKKTVQIEVNETDEKQGGGTVGEGLTYEKRNEHVENVASDILDMSEYGNEKRSKEKENGLATVNGDLNCERKTSVKSIHSDIFEEMDRQDNDSKLERSHKEDLVAVSGRMNFKRLQNLWKFVENNQGDLMDSMGEDNIESNSSALTYEQNHARFQQQHEVFDFQHVINISHRDTPASKHVIQESQYNVLKETDDVNNRNESNLKELNEIHVNSFNSEEESRKEIEEQLINILQETTLELEHKTEDKWGEKDQAFEPNFPPPVVDYDAPATLGDDNNNDIDYMNQLIDDLMIEDQDEDIRGDDCISLDNDRTNLDNSGVDWDNGGIHEGNLGVDVDDYANKGWISDDNVEVDVDSVGIHLHNDGELNVVNVNADTVCGVNADDGRMSGDDIEVDMGIDKFGLDVDNHELNVDTRQGQEKEQSSPDDSPMFMKQEKTFKNYEIISESSVIETPIVCDDWSKRNEKNNLREESHSEMKKTSDSDSALTEIIDDDEIDQDNLGVHLDNVGINVDDCRINVDNDTIHKANSRVDVDACVVSDNEDKIDFIPDLNEDNLALDSNVLIDLLRRQSDGLSSQESLDLDTNQRIVEVTDDEVNFGDCPISENSTAPKLVNEEQNSKDFERSSAPSKILLGKTTNEVTKVCEPRNDLYKDNQGLSKCETDTDEGQLRISEYVKDQIVDLKDRDGIPEVHQYSEESDNSDDDFSRVLEDIQEEESEYEDLMGYRGTLVTSNENEVQKQAGLLVSSAAAGLRSGQSTNEGNMSTQFSSAIIIDLGTGYCKAGFSIDDEPRVIIPSVVGTPRPQVANTGRYKDYYVGDEAKHLHQVLDLHHPMKNGLVQDWELVEKLLDEVFEELRCESDQYPVLVSEPMFNPKSNREEMIQVMFETFHVPAAYCCAQAVLSLFASGRTTGLVYDCGFSKAHSVPIYEGYALPHAITCTELAGHELTMCLSRMLRDRGVSLETRVELDIVQDIKEKLCYVVMDYDSERKAYNIGERNDTTYTMPDGQIIAVGSERFRCPEVLFTPSMVGMATDGVHEVVYKSVLQCDIDVRSSLFQNIVISGGSTKFPGFARRLHLELCKLLGTRSSESINIDAVEERNALTWQGGAMLSKLSNFSSMWITSYEYEEFGPDIVHKKCV